jgi:hypothetical protein
VKEDSPKYRIFNVRMWPLGRPQTIYEPANMYVAYWHVSDMADLSRQVRANPLLT